MRGYPKQIADEQDFRNLLSMPEFRERALADLRALYELDDDTITVCTDRKNRDIHLDRETVSVPNQNPVWKQKGFKSRAAVLALIKAFEQ